ncbi:MAG TPA: NAD(P)-dependent oxidoreductase [Candidatus Binataceae bacterium]|jgi:nucleoside-diphosphate-sugar epimerase|nr:NAD(P)-dependent oxidoreductase [Candidatus Binataceae bacterium]
MRIFLAGATGAVGRRMLPLLRRAGHDVAGTTRSQAKAQSLRAAGIEPVVVDVYDADALCAAVAAARPDVIVHQLTDLPAALKAELMAEGLMRNARLRIEGTRNLVEAALRAGVRRMVAQSIAFVYAPGPEPHAESHPLLRGAEGVMHATMEGVTTLERLTTATPGLGGLVLRYGMFYGPGTGFDAPPRRPGVHVDAAAWAAVLALERGGPGVYNVADDDGAVSIAKARRELGWDPAFRLDNAVG